MTVASAEQYSNYTHMVEIPRSKENYASTSSLVLQAEWSSFKVLKAIIFYLRMTSKLIMLLVLATTATLLHINWFITLTTILSKQCYQYLTIFCTKIT